MTTRSPENAIEFGRGAEGLRRVRVRSALAGDWIRRHGKKTYGLSERSVLLPPDIGEALDRLAAKREVSAHVLMREAIVHWVLDRQDLPPKAGECSLKRSACPGRRMIPAKSMTPGRRQLLAALQVTTTIEIGLRCHVTHQAVTQWANGQTKPSAKSQAMLREHVWTVVGPWDEEEREVVR